MLEKMYLTGKIEMELTPQGTLAERIRAAGAGIPAFFTPTGSKTAVQFGEVACVNDENGKVSERHQPRSGQVLRNMIRSPSKSR